MLIIFQALLLCTYCSYEIKSKKYKSRIRVSKESDVNVNLFTWQCQINIALVILKRYFRDICNKNTLMPPSTWAF